MRMTARRKTPARTGPTGRLSGPHGFSLVEVLVALVILSGTLMSLAAATAVVARMSTTTSASSQRAVATAEASGRLAAQPWVGLPAAGSCKKITGEVPMTQCVTVTNVTATHRRFTVIVSSETGADTTIVERRSTRGANPFSLP
jgi:prepilin-type N-terminal cleavage/methylation domain-containing protein